MVPIVLVEKGYKMVGHICTLVREGVKGGLDYLGGRGFEWVGQIALLHMLYWYHSYTYSSAQSNS